MRKNILFRPPGQVQSGAGRKKSEARIGQRLATLAPQQFVEFYLDRMKMEHVGRGIAKLSGRQFGRSPVGRLLLLREIDVEEVFAQILETVPVGEGAGQPRRDLG